MINLQGICLGKPPGISRQASTGSARTDFNLRQVIYPMNAKLLTHISTVISEAVHHPFKIRNFISVGGGSINAAFRLEGTDDTRYFLKLNDARHLAMLIAEAQGLAAIAATNTIRVPQPITYGMAGKQSYLVLEHLDLSSHGNAKLLGEQLAALHRCTPPTVDSNPGFIIEKHEPFDTPATRATLRLSSGQAQGEGPSEMETTPFVLSALRSKAYRSMSGVETSRFGFAQNNFIGTTPQPNAWKDNWPDFWREHRLGFQLRLAAQNGYGGQLQSLGEKLSDALPAFFAGYTPQPSLLHGDLWSGNHAYLQDGTPTIFDPATYYGDRECDIAMTELFGGYPADFYAAYRAAYPLDAGYATRRDLYNLYHILNHANLFGGGYARQAEQMMLRLLRNLD
jgi:protein-ribulosamine 3-kinase